MMPSSENRYSSDRHNTIQVIHICAKAFILAWFLWSVISLGSDGLF